MNAPPDTCCLNGEHRVLRQFRDGQAVECLQCARRYLAAEMFMDEACITPISLRLWKEIDSMELLNALPDGLDASSYVMDHKPYYALNLTTGALNPMA